MSEPSFTMGLSTEAKMSLPLEEIIKQRKKLKGGKGGQKGGNAAADGDKMEIDQDGSKAKKRRVRKKKTDTVVAGKQATKLGQSKERVSQALRGVTKAQQKAAREQKVAANRGIKTDANPKAIRPKLGPAKKVVVSARGNAVSAAPEGGNRRRRNRRKSGSSDTGAPAVNNNSSNNSNNNSIPNIKISFTNDASTPALKKRVKKPQPVQPTRAETVKAKDRQRSAQASSNSRQVAINKKRGIEVGGRRE
eukprot:Opistho-2@89035